MRISPEWKLPKVLERDTRAGRPQILVEHVAAKHLTHLGIHQMRHVGDPVFPQASSHGSGVRSGVQH